MDVRITPYPRTEDLIEAVETRLHRGNAPRESAEGMPGKLASKLVSRMQRQQAIGFLLYHGVAFAGEPFDPRPVEYVNPSPPVVDHATLLQLAGSLRHAFAPDSEHVSDQLLGHRHFTARQSVQRQQQPATQLLLDGVMPVTDGGLGHLRDQCLRVMSVRRSLCAASLLPLNLN